MKYIFSGVLVSFLFINVNANGLYNSVQKQARLMGESIEKINNIPIIDKLTNFLPFALVATCLKEYPGQTAVIFIGFMGYLLLRSESVRCALYKYNVLRKKQLVMNEIPEVDDTFFIFEDDSHGQESESILQHNPFNS